MGRERTGCMVSYTQLVSIGFDLAKETHPDGLDAQYSNELMSEIGAVWRSNPELNGMTKAQARNHLKEQINF